MAHPCATIPATLVALLLWAGHHSFARAATTAQFDVSATITSGCLVDGVGGSGDAGTLGMLDFGSDSTFSTAMHSATLAGSQAIRLRCTPGVSLTMSIDGGAHAAGGSRHLQSGGNPDARIAYALCSDAACNQPIAIGGNATISVSPANSEDIQIPLHGTLTLPGALPPGTYTDTLTVTLSW